MASAYAYVTIKRSSSLLADRHPGLVTTLEADTQPPLRQEHVVTVLVVQVVAEVREPRDAKAGIDQYTQDGGIATRHERGAPARLQQPRQLLVIEERLG